MYTTSITICWEDEVPGYTQVQSLWFKFIKTCKFL